MLASEVGDFDVVCLLLETGAHRDCTDRDGNTALMLAISGWSLDNRKLAARRRCCKRYRKS